MLEIFVLLLGLLDQTLIFPKLILALLLTDLEDVICLLIGLEFSDELLVGLL